MSAAGRHGILIKGGRYLEILGRVRTVAFDKTGTLTRGRPELVVVEPVEGTTAQELLLAAASLERLSEHPLAAAVLRAAEAGGVGDIRPASDFRALPGSGVEGVVDGKRIQILQPDSEGLHLDGLSERLEQLAASGITPAAVVSDGHPLGILGFRDEPRPEAASALRRLRAAGIRQLVVLGDRISPVVSRRRSGSTTREGPFRAKVDASDALLGVRPAGDAGDGSTMPALAAADVRIAMALGSDASIEAADVALADSLEHLDRRHVAFARSFARTSCSRSSS
jgi:cation transport ATPase